MKIVQLVTQRQYRGAEIAAAALTAQLTANGQEVVFAGLYKTNGQALTAEGAVNIDIGDFKRKQFSALVLYQLLRFVVQYKPDLIQANGSDTIKYAAVVKMLWPRFKLVYRNISILSVWLGKSRFKRKLYRWLFQQVDHITSVGYEAANDIGKTLLLPDSKITVIRRSVFSTTVNKAEAAAIIKHKYQWSAADRILFAAGSFSSEKNFSFLVEVMAQLCMQSKNIRLIIAGKGPEQEQIQQQIIEKGLQAFIILPGFEADLSTYYAAADVFVMCSKVEGVPGVILEAGLAATPAIANDTGGVKEVIQHGVTGILLPSLDVSSYVTTVLHLINNPALCTQLGEAARQFVTTAFNPEKNIETYINLYNRLTASVK